MGIEAARATRGELEKKGQCSADQLAKLTQALAAKVPTHEKLWKAVADRFNGQGGTEGLVSTITTAGRACMESVLTASDGPVFVGKDTLLRILENGSTPTEKPIEKLVERSSEPEKRKIPEPEKNREKDKIVKDKEKNRELEKAGKDSERSRDRGKTAKDTERSGDKEKNGKDREKSREREKIGKDVEKNKEKE